VHNVSDVRKHRIRQVVPLLYRFERAVVSVMG
jgi:hypothetical protein